MSPKASSATLEVKLLDAQRDGEGVWIPTYGLLRDGEVIGTYPTEREAELAKRANEPKRHKRRLPKVVSRDDAARILARVDDGTPDGLRNRLCLELMYRAGLRVSEVSDLKVAHVHLDSGTIDVLDAKGGDGTAYFPSEALTPLLRRWLEIRMGWLAAAGVKTDRLIIKPDGSRLSTRYLQRLMKKTKAELGLAVVCTPHVLRHTFATEALEDDFTLPEVQALLRHAHLQTTAVYLHVRDKSLQTKMARRRGTR